MFTGFIFFKLNLASKLPALRQEEIKLQPLLYSFKYPRICKGPGISYPEGQIRQGSSSYQVKLINIEISTGPASMVKLSSVLVLSPWLVWEQEIFLKLGTLMSQIQLPHMNHMKPTGIFTSYGTPKLQAKVLATFITLDLYLSPLQF